MSWFRRVDAGRPSAAAQHPYYPLDAPIPHFQPNSTPLPVLLGSFAGMLTTVVICSLILARRADRSLGRVDQALVGWFVLCWSLRPSLSVWGTQWTVC